MDFMNFVGYGIKKTQLHLAREYVLKLYTPGAREWGTLIKRFDELDSSDENTPLSSTGADDNLAAWLGDLDIDDGDSHSREHGACLGEGRRRNGRSAPSDRGMGNHELYRCSWCGNPSAVLKKCSACGKTRFVDSQGWVAG